MKRRLIRYLISKQQGRLARKISERLYWEVKWELEFR